MQLIRRNLSAGLTSIALLASCVLLGPAFAEATTLNVSGEYSSSPLNPATGTFSGTITTNGNNIVDVDITFPVVSDFTYVADSLPAGNNWDLTAASLDGLELDLVFSTTPIPGSLIGFTGGSIVSGQVIDPEGGFTLFQGFSGSISPSITSRSPVPEPSSLTLLALGFLAFGFPRKRSLTRKLQSLALSVVAANRRPSKAVFTLLISCILVGPTFARADTITTFDVSGQYSIELSAPAQGTFSGTMEVDTDSGTLTAVDIKFDAWAAEFNNLSESSPSGDNWELTAYDYVSDKLELTFASFPNQGSLVKLVEGVIISGQVLDNPGDFALFQGLSGSISPALTSASPVPEPSSPALLALGFTAFGFAAAKAALKRNLRG